MSSGEREWEGVGEIHTCEYWRESGRGLERYTHVNTGERGGGGWREIHICENWRERWVRTSCRYFWLPTASNSFTTRWG